MRLVTTTALALALAAPGYAVLAQETKTDATPDATAGSAAAGGVYMAKAEKTDVFGSDFIGKEVYVKQSAGAEAQGEAAEEMSEARTEANAEMADAKEEATDEMADAKDEGAEEQAEARQEASQEMADAKADAQEDLAEGKEEASDEMADADDGPEWDSIGEVSDVVMTRDGDVKAVLVDVGGFLGMGAKTVAITMEELAWETEEGDDEPFLVLKSDRAALENAPEFERNPDAGMDRAAATSTQAASGTMATGAATGAGATGALPSAEQATPSTDRAMTEADDAADETEQAIDEAASDTAEVAENAAEEVEETTEQAGEAIDEAATDTAQATDQATDKMAAGTDAQTNQAAAPEGAAGKLTKMDAAGYREVEAAGLTAETVSGATVYDMGNEDIGEVVDLVLSDDGAMDEAIIDVGGFLGLGEHRVAVRMSDLKIMQADDDPDDVRVYVASTKEELEEMPEVEIDG
tara:strand:+ start:5256 stop:6653 length:1398 start_codon:yes stop_codon:yes gene_type:complete